MAKLVDMVKFEYTPATVIALTDYSNVTCVAYKLAQTKPLILSCMGKGELFVNPAVETPSLTWYIDYSNKNNLTDLDLTTRASGIINNTEYADVVLADYGSVKRRILLSKTEGATGVYHRLLVSADGVNWSVVSETGGTATIVTLAEVRYAKIQAKQTANYLNSNLYELDAFDTTNCVLYKNISVKDKIVIEELTENVYFIFVNPTPTLSFSAFNRAMPTTLKGVIVQ